VRVLVVAATEVEVSPFISALRRVAPVGQRVTRYQCAGHDVDVLISGVGMVATATWCSQVLSAERFDVALDLGVCGSFKPEIFPGSVVHVVSDRLAELGAEDGDGFLTIQEMKLLGDDDFPFTGGRLVNASPPVLGPLSRMRAVNGITVNTVHGNQDSIARVTKRFSPEVESMEGAAFMYACLVRGVPFAQVRAVSNLVERRNRAAWKLDEALANLATVARQMLEL
jgi:futalosine hydrolase